MNVRGLGWALAVGGRARGVRGRGTAAWRRRDSTTVAPSRRGPQRARVPGAVVEADPQPGGGVLRFARSSLLVRVSVDGAVFCGWDGAEPTPSYAVLGPGPEPDARTSVEPDKDGGWRVVSERVLVTISRCGAVDIRTPGGALLRRDLPPRWWEAAAETRGDRAGRDGKAGRGDRAGEHGHWIQRSQVAADARFFGLGTRAQGPQLRNGAYRLWSGDRGRSESAGRISALSMPVQLVVADAGTHLVFHDNTEDGTSVIQTGEMGAGSGHDRPGRCELRMSGGPLRYWVLPGTPFRVLRGWTKLTGAPALPPRWALGYQHLGGGPDPVRGVRRLLSDFHNRRLPLRALHLHGAQQHEHAPRATGPERVPKLSELAAELSEHGVRLVAALHPADPSPPGSGRQERDTAVGALVADGRGGQGRQDGWPGQPVHSYVPGARVRAWWSGLYPEQVARGAWEAWHDLLAPVSRSAPGGATLTRSARHTLEGDGGAPPEARHLRALTLHQSAYQELRDQHPERRPFVLSRSGWAGTQRYGGVWSSEPESSWAGLRATLALVLATGLCGVPYVGPDIGGGTGAPSAELYLRWFQLGAYLPLFRTRAVCGTRRGEPWEFGSQVLEDTRAALRERERLLPYFVTLAHLAQRDGTPYVRPMWWQTPKDRALRDCVDAFLLGDALLVAPVCEPGATQRAVRLPHGQWYDTATGAVLQGPGQVTLAAPLSRIPVLARAGAVIPVVGPDGGIELEVWAPARGRTGVGLVIADAGDGWRRPVVERFTVRLQGDEPVVDRDRGDVPVGYPVRVRGTGA